MPYIKVKDGERTCVHKKNPDGTAGERMACHDTDAEADRQMAALRANEPDMHSFYLNIDEYVNVRAGEPYRLLPFGRIVKNGKSRDITPEIAARFRLPHFKPPIKLGSHEDSAPGGGTLIGLEVRADGLYGIPELTDKGAKTLTDGDYRYHSPEIIWEGGGYEDPTTGELIEGPLIVGDALLHTPHLGERAALYETIHLQRSETMTDQNEQVSLGLLERLVALFNKPQATPEVQELITEPTHEPEGVKPEEFQAIVTERDSYKAELDQLKAQGERQAQLDKFTAELKATKADAEAGPEMLAGMTAEQSEWVVAQFKALSAQIEANDVITEELGTDGEGPAQDDLNSVVLAKVAELKVSYNDALAIVAKENPDLVAGYKQSKEK